ncbi:hypothetical protein SY88_19675 [Clostridiales bacterium PH28_bin88]|nr:hypothetical protein SY88_19675 [Clostridiales bacterium PH28_bin88]
MFVLLISMGMLYFFLKVRFILPPFFLAVVLAYLLNPMVELIQGKGFSRVSAILIVYFSCIFFTYLLVAYGFPVFLRELDVFAEAIPDYTLRVQSLVREFYQRYQRIDIPESVRQVIDETLVGLEASLTAGVRQLAQATINFFTQLMSLMLAPVLTFYLLKDAEHINRRLAAVIPVSWRTHVLPLWEEVDRVLMKFIRGHLLVASMVGVLTSLGLALVGVKFYLLLGIIAGIADLIPYFGPIIGAIPAVGLALLNSSQQALYVLLVMVVVQQVENNLLSPTILGDSVGLHPVVVIFVLLAGGHLFGILGMLLAVPLTAILRIIVNYLYTLLVS